MPHKKVKHQHDTEIMIPRVALDYFFLTSKNDTKDKKDKKETGTEEEKGINPMIVMKDEGTSERYARMVEHKGLHD